MQITYDYRCSLRTYEPDDDELEEALIKIFSEYYSIDIKIVKDVLIYDEWLDINKMQEVFYDKLKEHFEKDAFECFSINDEYGL